jgi:hypothetical protein
VKKFVAARPFADPDAVARKLVEIANATEAVQDGRIYIELVNAAYEDPMKSKGLGRWLQGDLHQPR